MATSQATSKVIAVNLYNKEKWQKGDLLQIAFLLHSDS